MACGMVLITSGRKRGIQTCGTLCIFHCSKTTNQHLTSKGGISSTKKENIQCGKVGVGLDTRIFIFNALH